ncbi:MAG: hypothetical protein JJ992_02080 [Planctomycetes bacterium]|nr:hypothetical protein [Planctomycetota bacterium]
MIDLVIVVVGVFIGIQVANWNEVRLNRQLELETLAGISTDLRADRRSLQEAIALADANIQAGNHALTAAGLDPVESVELPVQSSIAGESIEVPSFLTGMDDSMRESLWSRLVVRYFPSPNDAAFSTLVATGRLGLISDRSLVGALQSYKGQWDNLDTSQNRTLRPFRNQTVFVGQKYGLSPFGRLPEEEYLKLLLDHSDLRGAMRTHLEYVVIHRNLLAQTLELTEGLLARVEQAVGSGS